MLGQFWGNFVKLGFWGNLNFKTMVVLNHFQV